MKDQFCYFVFCRFISEIEAVCRLWLADGPKNLLVRLLGCEPVSFINCILLTNKTQKDMRAHMFFGCYQRIHPLSNLLDAFQAHGFEVFDLVISFSSIYNFLMWNIHHLSVPCGEKTNNDLTWEVFNALNFEWSSLVKKIIGGANAIFFI